MKGNRKEEIRVCTILLRIFGKSPTPSENRLTANMDLKKDKVCLMIKTRSVQVEYHRSTTWVPTTS